MFEEADFWYVWKRIFLIFLKPDKDISWDILLTKLTRPSFCEKTFFNKSYFVLLKNQKAFPTIIFLRDSKLLSFYCNKRKYPKCSLVLQNFPRKFWRLQTKINQEGNRLSFKHFLTKSFNKFIKFCNNALYD
jgi:hypothetical protein